jgi:hypothetical protein
MGRVLDPIPRLPAFLRQRQLAADIQRPHARVPPAGVLFAEGMTSDTHWSSIRKDREYVEMRFGHACQKPTIDLFLHANHYITNSHKG